MLIISSETLFLAEILSVESCTILFVEGTTKCLQKFSQLENLSLKNGHHSCSNWSPSLQKNVFEITFLTLLIDILVSTLLLSLISFLLFGLYLIEVHSETVELFLAFIVLAVGVSKVLAEDVPGAAEVGKRGIESF